MNRADGTLLGSAFYFEGLPFIDRSNVHVAVVAHSTHLTLYEMNDEPFVSIPYSNLRDARPGGVKKGIGGRLFADLTGGSGYVDGTWITYEDAKLQREVSLFLGYHMGDGLQKGKNLAKLIWDARDRFMMTINSTGFDQRG